MKILWENLIPAAGYFWILNLYQNKKVAYQNTKQCKDLGGFRTISL
ncbi:hypothetical protein QMM60_04810 [Leptospira santarosai]|nr:hypothetical protein [Leptospira santarosai]